MALCAFLPDPEGDAAGHYSIARTLLSHPLDLGAHWVWLPGWHCVLALLQAAGLSFAQVRLFDAALQTAGPPLLYVFAKRAFAGASDWVPLGAACAWALAPLAEILGASAEPETFFTLLVLGASALLHARRAVPCTLLLAGACLVRYEAWAVTLALGGWWALGRVARGSRIARAAFEPVVFLFPAAIILTWVLLRWRVDGTPLWFLTETQRFARNIPRIHAPGPLRIVGDALWYPCIAPLIVLGPAAVFIPLGARSLVRSACVEAVVIPGAILLMLTVTFVFHGNVGFLRHLTPLMPFACLGAVLGLDAFVARRSETAPRTALVALLLTLAVTTGLHVLRLAVWPRPSVPAWLAGSSRGRSALRDAPGPRASVVRGDALL